MAHRQRPDILDGFHQIQASALMLVVLAHGALDLRMTGVTDQDHLTPGAGVAADFHVDLGDQRTGGVEHLEAALRRLFPHRSRHPVSAEDQRRPVGHLVQFFDEHRTAPAQIIHHKPVMHYFMTHVDRRSEQIQRPLDNTDGPVYSGAKATGIGKMDLYAHAVLPENRGWLRNHPPDFSVGHCFWTTDYPGSAALRQG